jgi:hypothetical protein
MCVVWAKRNPEAMYHVEQRKKPEPQKSEPAAGRRESTAHGKNAVTPPEQKYPDKPAPAQVYDLSSYGVDKRDDSRHLLDKPELLTEEAIGALCKLGIEVTVKTDAGMEVTLVPKLTGADRCELTFEHARTLVMVLQVFPGATVQQIVKPNQEEAS